ncbi:LysR family transcriptional regulator [Acetobacter nitrogenifigens DSM 23921 = NBRC 105050]|uniref:Transcriptional regulator n=1 Tax=Acetobacter nitrogenifigens DSM 23921 = NBRC 105050 TaxID=1120919 RepID=A0A511XBX6_9PROT|nr:LysR family transcriptional regulator [Acetobacter nitrogenifigens]GBQ90351.1 LysR family transcriptional regulator [Acetobacter nitrogenifigens DSM 23921 = NBRC 105050]GEN60371.1 transcriptional regulator [Acetobacter nitrogenifigens DSM 23921 = NBRC 105050]
MDALKLSQLQFFCAIMEEGSIVAASRRMHCVASNITARLKELEQILGQELFLREKGRLIVTPAARLLYREVTPLVAGLGRLPHLFDADKPRGILKVGALDVALRHFLPERLPAFAAAYPGVELALLTRPSYTLERMLSDGELDLVLTDGPIQHPLLDSRFAFSESLSLVTPRSIKAVDDIDWLTTTVFLFNTDCFYRNRFEGWLNARGLETPAIQTIESYDVLRACVAAGLGVSCFPDSMLHERSENDGGNVRVFRPEDLDPGPVYFVWRREALSIPGARFVEHCLGS